jgi:hypothetical protein
VSIAQSTGTLREEPPITARSAGGTSPDAIGDGVITARSS